MTGAASSKNAFMPPGTNVSNMVEGVFAALVQVWAVPRGTNRKLPGSARTSAPATANRNAPAST